jgi:hypothetical protein
MFDISLQGFIAVSRSIGSLFPKFGYIAASTCTSCGKQESKWLLTIHDSGTAFPFEASGLDWRRVVQELQTGGTSNDMSGGSMVARIATDRH